MIFSLRPRTCSAGSGIAGLPVFTEDACTDVDHRFSLTGPNGRAMELAARRSVPSADFEVGPFFTTPDGPDGTGDWTIEDLDHTEGTWAIPSCWTGSAERGMAPAVLAYVDAATYSVVWDEAGSMLTCDWFEFTPKGDGDTPHPLHLETIPTAEPLLRIGGPGDDLVMERAIRERPDIAVPMRLIDLANDEEITFEADADGTLLIQPGEYELINDRTGESQGFTTSNNGPTIALVGVPLDAIDPDTDSTGSPGTTSVDITVSTCADIVNGTGVDCTGIRYDEPQPLLEILVDGEPYADGPVPLMDTGVGWRARVDAPLDAVLSISVVENIPEGYVPAEGYAPLEIAAADVPEGGCGGESACPVIDMVLVPEGQ